MNTGPTVRKVFNHHFTLKKVYPVKSRGWIERMKNYPPLGTESTIQELIHFHPCSWSPETRKEKL